MKSSKEEKEWEEKAISEFLSAENLKSLEAMNFTIKKQV